MKILALIPARGGSKRVPNKNIRELGGLPLIVWTIKAAQGVPEISDILVSTDSEAIAEVARAAGALVPWLRPVELATDTSKSIDVCLHALTWYEAENGQVDGLLLLQPTSPFRSSATIKAGISNYLSSLRRSVVSVSPAKYHPFWCYEINDGGLTNFARVENMNYRSQDLPEVYALNGAVYLIEPNFLRSNRTLVPIGAKPLIMDDCFESIDIDTEDDWRIAELVTQVLVR